MRRMKKVLALALSACVASGSIFVAPVSISAAETSEVQMNQDSESLDYSENDSVEEQEGQQEAISEEQNTEDNQEQNEESEIIDNSQEDTYQTSEAETEDNQEAAVNENSQEMTEEESGQETETVLEADPAAENSWRYSNGNLISLPSTYTDYPYAWEKVDGKFVNSNGEVIPGAVKKGIDVSEHNGKIDWQKVKNDGIDFAIIRCGYGQDMESQDDDYWEYNVSECERLGIPYGVYLYSYANTLSKAESEARHVLRLLQGHSPSYPVYYDLEDNITLALTDDMKTQVAKTFCDVISGSGYQVGIYSNLDWWTNHLTDPVFDSWSRWMAQWNDTCTYDGEYDMWQCTSTGKVDGISTNVDLNFWIEEENSDNSDDNNSGETGGEGGQIAYSTHVQKDGWQSEVYDGSLSGTEGEAKRLEAIRIKLGSDISGGVRYSTHVQKNGWMDYVSDGALSGTTGEAKRLEAIKIELTGEASENYDIYYCVHAQTYGWLGWAKNGEPAGTAGYGKRLEAIKIVLVPKGGEAPGSTSNAYLEKAVSVQYRTHVQKLGWLDFVENGALSGTVGEAKRLEAIQIQLSNAQYSGGIEYCTHVQKDGWQGYVSNGALSGTAGEAKRLEAIRIRLTGEMSEKYDIYYRVHSQTYGWLGWAKNGEEAGTSGLAKRLEGIEIQILPKGSESPGSTENCYIQK